MTRLKEYDPSVLRYEVQVVDDKQNEQILYIDETDAEAAIRAARAEISRRAGKIVHNLTFISVKPI